MVSVSWRQTKRKHPKGIGKTTYPVHEALKYEIFYSLECESGNEIFIKGILKKVESALRMNLNCGDAQLKFISMRQDNG